jgi:hypothetical protein
MVNNKRNMSPERAHKRETNPVMQSSPWFKEIRGVVYNTPQEAKGRGEISPETEAEGRGESLPEGQGGRG